MSVTEGARRDLTARTDSGRRSSGWRLAYNAGRCSRGDGVTLWPLAFVGAKPADEDLNEGRRNDNEKYTR
jgi:hypothetical protein